jgi:hypothetical protein
MQRSVFLMGFLALYLLAVQPAVGSSPEIVGEVSGVELCPQFACGAAIFTGTCDCTVNGRHTVGFFWVAVQHDPLPESFASSLIFAGKWNLSTLRGKFSGNVLGGNIFNKNDNSFTITATLRLEKGGTGDVVVTGLLDHKEFPPTFEGELGQSEFQGAVLK